MSDLIPHPTANQPPPRIIVKPSPDPHWDDRQWVTGHVREIGRLMDSAFVIPGTRYRIGLDPIIGLIPFFGDIIGMAIGGYLILLGSRYGVPRAVLLRMLMNVGIDAVAGSVPLAGDVLDAAWKANAKNAALLERAMQDPKRTGRASLWMLLGLGVLFLAAMAGVILFTVWVFRLIWRAFE